MRRATEVKPMKNFLLLIKFDNGEEKIFNCLSLINDNLFSQIFNPDYFSRVHIDDMGIVCWDDETDINPYDLYDNSESVSDFFQAAYQEIKLKPNY